MKDKKKTCFARNVPFRCSHSTVHATPALLPPLLHPPTSPAAPSNAAPHPLAAAAGLFASCSPCHSSLLFYQSIYRCFLLLFSNFVVFQGDRGGPGGVLLPVRHRGGCRAAAQCRGCELPRRRPDSQRTGGQSGRSKLSACQPASATALHPLSGFCVTPNSPCTATYCPQLPCRQAERLLPRAIRHC